MGKIKCGTIQVNRLKIAGKPNRAMTPEVKLAPIWADRKKDYKRSKEKAKVRRYSEEYGNDEPLFFPFIDSYTLRAQLAMAAIS